MKLKYLMLMLIAMVWQSASGQENRQELVQFVAVINSATPISFGEGIYLKSVSIKKDTVVYNIVVDEYREINIDIYKDYSTELWLDELVVDYELNPDIGEFFD